MGLFDTLFGTLCIFFLQKNCSNNFFCDIWTDFDVHTVSAHQHKFKRSRSDLIDFQPLVVKFATRKQHIHVVVAHPGCGALLCLFTLWIGCVGLNSAQVLQRFQNLEMAAFEQLHVVGSSEWGPIALDEVEDVDWSGGGCPRSR